MKMTLDEQIKRISGEFDKEKDDFQPITVDDMANSIPKIDEKTIEMRPEKDLEFEIPKVNPKKKRKKKNRTVDMHARFTPEEAEKIQRERESVGMRPGEYIRHRMLGDVEFVVIDRDLLVEYVKSILLLKGEVGKIGGLLKLCIKRNEDNPLLTEADLDEIKGAIKSLARLEGQIQRAVNRKWQS